MKEINAAEIITLICQEYRITVYEFLSDYKYGDLPEARQLFCLTMLKLGWRNIDIARVINFSAPRVMQLTKIGKEFYIIVPYFKKRCDTLINKYITP